MKQGKKTGVRAAVKELVEQAKENLTVESQLEIMSNKRAVLQGVTGILRFGEESLRIQVHEQVVEFWGQGLAIDCLSADAVEIRGAIHRVEFQ